MEQVPPTQAAELAPCSGELTLFPHPTLTAHLCNVMHSARVEAGAGKLGDHEVQNLCNNNYKTTSS